MMNGRDVDVVIVGAGFAGLSAAVNIQKAGLSYVVVEAHDRIGGKSLSRALRSNPGLVEMGCTWTNDSNQKRIFGLVQKYGLQVKVQPTDGWELSQSSNGQIHRQKHGQHAETVPVEERQLYERLVETIETEAAKFDANSPGRLLDAGNSIGCADMTVHDWLKLQGADADSYAYQSVRFLCTGIFGSELAAISFYCFLELINTCSSWNSMASDEYGGGQYLKIKTGTTSICHGLEGELRPGSVLLASPAKEIIQKQYGCIVKLSTGLVLRCSKIILTNPSDTWHNIDFVPPLPDDKRRIAARGISGLYSKTVLTYKKPWWRDLGLLGKFASPRGPIDFSWDVSDETLGHYSIACFCVGRSLEKHAALSKYEREEAMLKSLVAFAGKEYEARICDVAEINEKLWNEDPWVGGVCYPSFGPMDYMELAPGLKTPFRNIHIAGTATASVWRGYMEGAVESGERAASEVVNALAMSSISVKL